MKDYFEIVSQFENLGAEFRLDATEIATQLDGIKAFVFDWDGVFNDGSKGSNIGSNYSEADSMGTNLLRFAYWLRHGHLPIVCIITGQNNHIAFELARREHFNAVYYKISHKTEALEHVSQEFGIQPSEVAFAFDDAVDLSAAKEAGLRLLIQRQASPLFKSFVLKNHLADYVSGSQGGMHAVREICEMMIGIGFDYDRVVSERMAFGEAYQDYLAQRNKDKPLFFSYREQKLVIAIPQSL